LIDFLGEGRYIAEVNKTLCCRKISPRSVRAALCALLLLAAPALLRAQGEIPVPPVLGRPDTASILGALKEPPASRGPGPAIAMGVDLLVSNGGFGLGTFYRRAYSEDVAGFIDFSISETKDDDEREFVNYYGQIITPGKVSRFLVMPLFIGVQKRLFRDDIVDNFRPYVTAAAGPAILYVFPADQEYFTGISNGHPVYTAGGYVGLGAYFGSEPASVMGISLRYYVMPYPAGIESMRNVLKKQFGGFYIAITFGSAW
jgi:hypothetical protein